MLMLIWLESVVWQFFEKNFFILCDKYDTVLLCGVCIRNQCRNMFAKTLTVELQFKPPYRMFYFVFRQTGNLWIFIYMTQQNGEAFTLIGQFKISEIKDEILRTRQRTQWSKLSPERLQKVKPVRHHSGPFRHCYRTDLRTFYNKMSHFCNIGLDIASRPKVGKD